MQGHEPLVVFVGQRLSKRHCAQNKALAAAEAAAAAAMQAHARLSSVASAWDMQPTRQERR
jgi:hypothetical protein